MLIGKLLPTIDDHVRGRVLVAVAVMTSGLSTLGPLLTGLLYQQIGSTAVIRLAVLAAATALPFTILNGPRQFASQPPTPNDRTA